MLTGFMGAGKTTVARELACLLSCRMIDLDDFLTTREGRTPQAMIDEDSEPQFRRMETRALREALEQATHAGLSPLLEEASMRAAPEESANSVSLNKHFIIALGGGTWTLARNRKLITAHDAQSIWLDAPFELCWRKIAGAAKKDNESDNVNNFVRPLARDYEKTRLLYDKRRAFYQLARWRVEVSEEKGAGMLAAEIAALIAAF